MAESHSCPNDAQLQSLIDGTLPADVQAALAAHLEICETCRQKLGALAGTSVAIPPSGSAVSEPADRSSALAEAMRRLKANQADETATVAAISIGGASLSFLAPSANPRHLGRLAGYEVLEVIGRGGMGIVLKARDPKLERLVAVKVLNPDLATSGPARARFLREARSAAAVTHEHVVTIHAVDDAGELPFLVMEYIVGVSLEDRIRRSGHLRLEEILRIGMQAALGLAAAHAQGLVHRDIKPSNILLENGVERVKITDFGLARVVHEAQITQTNLVAGTPQYMSPEQARGESVDHRSDLFSLGCVLYAMCTGRSPFRAETPTGAIHRVCNDAPRPIREVNPDLPDWLAAIIDRLLEKKPADRFQTADEVAEVLGQYLAHVQQPSRVELPKGIWRARAIGRGDAGAWKRLAAIAVGLAAIVLISLTAWQLASRQTPPKPNGPGPIVPTRFTMIDLQPYANRERTQSADSNASQNNLAEVPARLEVDSVPFKIGERYLHLGSEKVPGCPKSIAGIAVHRKVAKLHFLHGCSWAHVWGTQVATYRLNYEDGTSVELPVIDGRHLFNWWQYNRNQIQPTRATKAWIGSNPKVSQDGGQLEVYASTFENPHPEISIATIDFEHGGCKLPSPFCLAITCDEDPARLRPEQGAIAIRNGTVAGGGQLSFVIDGGTSRPIPTKTTQNILLPPGRHEIEILNGAQVARRGSVVLDAGGIAWLDMALAPMLFPLPTPQPEPEESLGESSGICDAAVSTDGNVLIVATRDGTLSVSERRGNKWVRRSAFSIRDQQVGGVALSGQAEWAATAGVDTGLKLWNLRQESEAILLNQDEIGASAAVFLADGRTLVSGKVDGTAEIWDIQARKRVGSFSAHPGRIVDLVLSADGKYLASCGEGENVAKLWEVGTWRVRQTFRGHTAPVSALAFSPDGTTIAGASGDSTAICWKVDTADIVHTFIHPQGLQAIAFSADGKRLAAGGAFQTVRIWDLASGISMHDFQAHWAAICFVAFSADGERLITAGMDNSTRIWSIASLPAPFEPPRLLPTPLATFFVHGDWSMCPAFSPKSGDQIAAVGMVPKVTVWNLKDLSRLRSFNARVGEEGYMPSHSLLYAPDESTLVTCLMRQDSPLIGLWDTQRYRLRKAFVADPTPVEKVFSFAAISLSHDGEMLAVASQRHGLVAVACLATTSPCWSAEVTSENPSSVSFSPDDQVLAVGTQSGLVLLLDAKTGREIRRFQHGRQTVTAVTFSADGTLASGNKEGIVRLWAASSFEPIELPKAHKEVIWSAAFSPDGRLLVTSGGMWDLAEALGTHKGEVCVWNVAERKLVARFEAHYGSVTCAVFSPDGKRLATTGRDGKMHLWDVEEVLQKAAVKDTEPEKGEVTAATVSVGKDQ